MSDRLAAEVSHWEQQVQQPRRMLFRRNWYKRINARLSERMIESMGDLRGRRVLFVGCGGSTTTARKMAELGGEIWCLDVSAAPLEQFRKGPFGELAPRIHPVQGDAEDMPFDKGFFDVAVGKAIVHHLDIRRFLDQLWRVCAPQGRIVFCEPLGLNPLINLFRRLTPRIRTRTEHPLTRKDIQAFCRRCRWLKLDYHECLATAAYPIYISGLVGLGDLAHRVLCFLDRLLFAVLPPARWLAWCVMIVGCLNNETGASGATDSPSC